MKKITVSLLALAMTLSLVACGGKTPEPAPTPDPTPSESQQDSQAPDDTTDIAPDTQVDEPVSGDSITGGDTVLGETLGRQLGALFLSEIEGTSDLEALATSLGQESGFDCVVAPVSEGFLTGFTAGYQFAPMIGSIPFVGYVFETDDAEGLQTTLLSLADPRWNICTEAAETICLTAGNHVFFTMCPGDDY